MATGKIGIITHFYKSQNYGGVLQAYALCRFLRARGYEAEQIQFNKEQGQSLKRRFGKLYRSLLTIPKRVQYGKIYEELADRKNKFAAFREKKVPHSEKVFSQKSLRQLAAEYELFITGSDQVWHPNAVCDAYLLDFGVADVKKMSYAASIAKNSLSEEEKERYKKALRDYRAISVREKEAVALLQSIAPCDIQWVVDPVFLLRKEEWKALTQNEGAMEQGDPYVLCYFLGTNQGMRDLARKYADKKKLKLRSISHLNGEICESDIGFGDMGMIDASPTDFLRLIQNAEIVFTDSFHAMAFSLLFEKQFFVFERDGQDSMGSRIESLAELFEVSNRYCNGSGQMTMDYLEKIAPINYTKSFSNFEKMRNASISFLIDNVDLCFKEGGK